MVEYAARVLGASLVAVELAHLPTGTVVWDVLPVGEFRSARLLGETTIGEAIADLVQQRTPAMEHADVTARQPITIEGGDRHGIQLSA